MKKSFKTLLALALALILCLSLGVTAFAVDNPETDASAYVTKELQMPAGTAIPATTFKFTATAVSVDGKTAEAGTAPAATIADVGFAAADASTAASGVKSAVHSSAVSFGAFPHAGVYVYTVKETADTNTFADSNKQTLSYSKAEYEMQVYVANKAADGLYIASFAIYQTKDDSGAAIAQPTKITAGENGAFRFINKYSEKAGSVDPDDPTAYSSLKISNTVAGNMRDKKTLDFKYTLTVTPTAFEATDATYTVTKHSADGSTADTTVTGGVAYDFTLKHGEYISVKNMLVGSSYTVSEHDVDSNYTVTAAAGDAVSTDQKTVNGTLVSAGNTAAYTNTYNKEIPTGIIINNLPYIMLIAVACTGLALYLAGKRRREQEG